MNHKLAIVADCGTNSNIRSQSKKFIQTDLNDFNYSCHTCHSNESHFRLVLVYGLIDFTYFFSLVLN